MNLALFELNNMIRISFDSLAVNDVTEFKFWLKEYVSGSYFVGFSEVYFKKIKMQYYLN